MPSGPADSLLSKAPSACASRSRCKSTLWTTPCSVTPKPTWWTESSPSASTCDRRTLRPRTEFGVGGGCRSTSVVHTGVLHPEHLWPPRTGMVGVAGVRVGFPVVGHLTDVDHFADEQDVTSFPARASLQLHGLAHLTVQPTHRGGEDGHTLCHFHDRLTLYGGDGPVRPEFHLAGRLDESAHNGPVRAGEDGDRKFFAFLDQLPGYRTCLDGDCHQLRGRRRLHDQVGGHQVHVITPSASYHEEPCWHRPQHPSSQPVILLGVTSLGNGPGDTGFGGHVLFLSATAHAPLQFPNGSTFEPSGAVVVVVEGTCPVIDMIRSNAVVNWVLVLVRPAADVASSFELLPAPL